MKSYLTGANGAAEAIRRGRGLLLVCRKDGRAGELAESARSRGVPVRSISPGELDGLVSPGTHRGFALEVKGAGAAREGGGLELLEAAGGSSLVVVLDGITDPGNLGAVLRSADQFGADAVVVPRRRSAGRDADILSRASAGAVEWVSLVEAANLARALKDLKAQGYWIWGADMAGDAAHGVNLSGKIALVLGSEGKGLQRLTREGCDGLVGIPARGRVDSLNAATAAGILMYEVRRQQNFR